VDFEEIFFFVKSRKYYFEQQFEELKAPIIAKRTQNPNDSVGTGFGNGDGNNNHHAFGSPNPQGRNKRTVWNVTTKGYKGAHFATFPEELIETPIKAGCPEYICTKCGKPREKIYEYTGNDIPKGGGRCIKYGLPESGLKLSPTSTLLTKTLKEKAEAGYTQCQCNALFRSGIVLDPFMGAGTTALVALKQNKQFIGIDINPKYIEMAYERIKPLLQQSKLFEKELVCNV